MVTQCVQFFRIACSTSFTYMPGCIPAAFMFATDLLLSMIGERHFSKPTDQRMKAQLNAIIDIIKLIRPLKGCLNITECVYPVL
jgi:hypothetical protein